MDSKHDTTPISNVVIFPPTRRNLAKPAEINFHKEILLAYGEHGDLRRTFTVEQDIPQTLERGKNVDYAWHKYAPGFGVRIMRLRRPKGHLAQDEASRYYIARYREHGGKDGAKPLHEDSRRARWGMPPRTEAVEAALESCIGIGEERLSPATIATYRKRWSVLPERWRERKMDEISPRELTLVRFSKHLKLEFGYLGARFLTFRRELTRGQATK